MLLFLCMSKRVELFLAGVGSLLEIGRGIERRAARPYSVPLDAHGFFALCQKQTADDFWSAIHSREGRELLGR